jgi:hypothetical protein
MKRCVVRVNKAFGFWWTAHGDLRVKSEKQWHAVEIARDWAGMHADSGGISQVVVHKANGAIRNEWTYPRSSDPKRTKG